LHGHNGQIRNGDAHYKARLDVISAQSSLAADAAKGIASGQRTLTRSAIADQHQSLHRNDSADGHWLPGSSGRRQPPNHDILAAMKKASSAPLTGCCDKMSAQLAWRCDRHRDPEDCPDALVNSSACTVPLKPRTLLWNDYGFNQGFETIHEL
jgi:hypothetical protein